MIDWDAIFYVTVFSLYLAVVCPLIGTMLIGKNVSSNWIGRGYVECAIRGVVATLVVLLVLVCSYSIYLKIMGGVE